MPKIETLFDGTSAHLKLLRDNGLTSAAGEFICPICLNEFTKEQLEELSLEDAPQEALGGHKIAITCKVCNNRAGHEVDVHLFNYLKYIEQRHFYPGSDRKVTAYDDGGLKLNASLRVPTGGDLELLVSPKNNNPNTLEINLSKMRKGALIDIKNHPLKIDMQCVTAAIIKNAYIILFARFGYSFLLNPFYDKLREQIKNPVRCILPEALWTKQSTSPITDGIYLSNNNRYKGFFVAFTLCNKCSCVEHYFCVNIPVPKVYYEAISTYFKHEYMAGMPLQMYSIGTEENFLFDIERIKKLKYWIDHWDIIY